MDGINGITGLYSFVILSTLYYIINYKIIFTDVNFIIYPVLASLVFLFLILEKSKCFAGDVEV